MPKGGGAKKRGNAHKIKKGAKGKGGRQAARSSTRPQNRKSR